MTDYDDLKMDESKAIKQDLAQYFKDNVAVGFELELVSNHKGFEIRCLNCGSTVGDVGIYMGWYDDAYPTFECDVCGQKYDPDGFIPGKKIKK